MYMNTKEKWEINEDFQISGLSNCVDDFRDKISTILKMLSLRMWDIQVELSSSSHHCQNLCKYKYYFIHIKIVNFNIS